MAVASRAEGEVARLVAASLDSAATALTSADPLEDPLFPTSLLDAQAALGLPFDPLPLLRYWAGRAHGQVGTTRYRWAISPRLVLHAPAYIGPQEAWAPWRPRDRAAVAEDRSGFEQRLLTPLVLAESIEWLSRLAGFEGEVGELAQTFLAECRATARRDAAFYAQERHAWGDTWALWCFAERPHVLRLLHPFALAIAEAYADTTIAAGQVAVLGTRFPFAGVPLVSASAQLATGCLALGIHPKLTGALAAWLGAQRRFDGGFGDGDGPSDVLTTLVAAELLAGLDPRWEPVSAASYLVSMQGSDGWWRAYGPETAWLTLAVRRFLENAGQPFTARFAWPEVALTSRDRRTGLPRYDYYADLARLCQEVPGLGEASIEVAFLDLAGFGAFNNRHGMATGDAVLREFAQALASMPGVMAIRDGGDEFLAVGVPTAQGLAATLDAFRRNWPTRLRAGFGPDAHVVPRILVASTTGAGLVATRDELGRRITALKTTHLADAMSPEGVLVRLERHA